MSEKLHIYYKEHDDNIYKQIIDYREHWRGLEKLRHATPFDIIDVHRMSNPYIYAEAGITEQDINDYEFANAVPATKFQQLETLVNAGVIRTGEEYLKALESGPPVASEFKGLGEMFSEPKQCDCDSKDLFNFGCKCGGV
jgi:hypothetical protein